MKYELTEKKSKQPKIKIKFLNIATKKIKLKLPYSISVNQTKGNLNLKKLQKNRFAIKLKKSVRKKILRFLFFF